MYFAPLELDPVSSGERDGVALSMFRSGASMDQYYGTINSMYTSCCSAIACVIAVG